MKIAFLATDLGGRPRFRRGRHYCADWRREPGAPRPVLELVSVAVLARVMIIHYHYHVHGTSASLLGFAFLPGLRHGVDPDHLAALDGMARLRNSRWNGVWFAAGHSFVVTLLAVGIGHIDLGPLERLTPYLLVAIGVANLMRLFRSGYPHHPPRPPSASQLVLGIIFAAGFETASLKSPPLSLRAR